ncbi:lithostathine-1-like [Hemibagrus wyckioides]|uniref:lithostathine-1-like n=1 Tax=Hemibagrus wyckioides TaxID=337641 RepID=UPI00266D4460|nr:lithostathine-1-like [Hemibagrus wyckioides]
MNTVKKILENITTTDVWIGLKYNSTNKSWVWSDNTTFNYSYWNYGEPSSPNTSNCVQIKRDQIINSTWNDSGCQFNCMFVCYKRRTPIIMIPENKTWKEARRYCRQNHVDLVSVHSQEMQNWVATATSNVSTNVWIGLRHTHALGFWYWVRGEMICYQNWAPGNGTGVEDCNDVERTGAMLSESKKWVSLPETQALGFICITF